MGRRDGPGAVVVGQRSDYVILRTVCQAGTGRRKPRVFVSVLDAWPAATTDFVCASLRLCIYACVCVCVLCLLPRGFFEAQRDCQAWHPILQGVTLCVDLVGVCE